MCDFPTCNKPSSFNRVNGDKQINLCSEHEALYEFIVKVLAFENDWGL
jgi:hypothetical protein